MYFIHEYASPLGGITLASDGQKLTGLWFDGQKYFAADLPREHAREDLAVFRRARAWLDIYFSGRAPDIPLPLSTEGATPFRRRVWEILREIPYGQTATYGQIAERLQKETGSRVSARAVGGAVGHNPLSIVIPCHRVIGADGNVTGYAGGIAKKLALLQLEGVDPAALCLPREDALRSAPAADFTISCF